MIGTTLRRLRLARGLTQTQLAAPKYTHAYVSSIEAGRRQPSREALKHFAQKLGVEVDELETGQAPDVAAQMELRVQESLIDLSAGRLVEAEKALTSIAKEAKRTGLRRIEARTEEGLGLLLERQERPEEALEHFQRSEAILAAEPPTAWVEAVAGKARSFHCLGDVRYEIHILESLLGRIEREGLHDPNALSRLHGGLLFAYVEAGLYQKAADSAAELERLRPAITDPLRLAQMHMNVARVHLVQGHVAEAERSLRRAEDAYRQLGLKTETGYAHLARGYVLSRAGKVRDAKRELTRAVVVFEETADRKDLTRTLNELARLERQSGHSEKARELLMRSIGLMGDADTPILAWAHRELGLVLTELDPTAAEKSLRLAIELYERSEQAVEIAVTYRALGDLLSSRGEHEAGCDAYRTGITALEPGL